MTIVIWLGAFALYLIFRLWYDGLRKPLTASEIKQFSKLLEKRAARGLEQQDLDILLKFMEEDDGKEFIMLNMVEFNPSPITHPDTGKTIKAPKLLQEYFTPLMKTLLGRAGHPVLTGRVVGGYIESWNTPPDPGWHVAGLVRYRSRRDALEATLADASFDEIHKYKVAAIKQTFAVPTQLVAGGFFVAPRVTVALGLALVASLIQIVLIG